MPLKLYLVLFLNFFLYSWKISTQSYLLRQNIGKNLEMFRHFLSPLVIKSISIMSRNIPEKFVLASSEILILILILRYIKIIILLNWPLISRNGILAMRYSHNFPVKPNNSASAQAGKVPTTKQKCVLIIHFAIALIHFLWSEYFMGVCL